MNQFYLFNTPKKYIPQLSKLNGFWDKFDNNCFRKDVNLDINNIYSIIKCQPYFVNEKIKNYTSHYIKYNISGAYKIEEHTDSSDITIIIYLSKDSNLADEFYVDNVNTKITWNNQKYNYDSLIMWNNSKHYGKISGFGKRDILCLFVNFE